MNTNNIKKSQEIANYYNIASDNEKELFDKFVEMLEDDVYIDHLSYLECAKKYGYYQVDMLESRTEAISANSIADFIFKRAWEFWYYSVLEGIIEKEINRFSDVNDTKKRFWMFLTVFLIIIAIIK